MSLPPAAPRSWSPDELPAKNCFWRPCSAIFFFVRDRSVISAAHSKLPSGIGPHFMLCSGQVVSGASEMRVEIGKDGGT